MTTVYNDYNLKRKILFKGLQLIKIVVDGKIITAFLLIQSKRVWYVYEKWKTPLGVKPLFEAKTLKEAADKIVEHMNK